MRFTTYKALCTSGLENRLSLRLLGTKSQRMGEDEERLQTKGKAQVGTRGEKGHGRMRRQTKFTGISPGGMEGMLRQRRRYLPSLRKGRRVTGCALRQQSTRRHGDSDELVMLCPECHREADQGDGKEIKREMREYLQSM